MAAMSTSLPSASGSVHHARACASLSRWPPAGTPARPGAPGWSRHAFASQADGGRRVDAVDLPEPLGDRAALAERMGAEVGAAALPHDPPVLHALGLVELPGRQVLAHSGYSPVAPSIDSRRR